MDAKEVDKKFTEILEILNEGVHEPAGSGCGFGFRIEEQEQASEIFKSVVEEYAQQKCIEQKEICLKKGYETVLKLVAYGTNSVSPKDVKESILNAPLATDK